MTGTYKGVIFDFNGTLFFDNDKHILAWGEISKMLRGRGITEEELLEHFNGVPNQKIVAYLLGREGIKEEIEIYSQLKEELYRKFCLEDKENFHLVDGAKEFFDYLNEKGIPFTIASASIKANIDFFVREFELENKIFTCLNDFCSMKKFTPVLKLKRTNSSGYKYPKLSELTAYFNITEKEISKKTQELFNEELLFHDARYDTTAVYLALNRAMDSVEQFKNLKELID